MTPRMDSAVRVPAIFLRINAAIARAHAEGDNETVDYLLVAKLAMVRRYHGLSVSA